MHMPIIVSGINAMVFQARMSKDCPSDRDFKGDITIFKQEECQYIFEYILKHFGIDNALTYCSVSKDVQKYNIQINTDNIVYCEYDKIKQCNLFCPYFFGKCTKED